MKTKSFIVSLDHGNMYMLKATLLKSVVAKSLIMIVLNEESRVQNPVYHIINILYQLKKIKNFPVRKKN